MTQRVIILGAAGRDFHNFNVCFRHNPAYTVIAFTATQIPNIAGRRYPPELAGPYYPDGIPIFPESDLPDLIHSHNVDLVVFGYSDVSYDHVMQVGAGVLAAGASYLMVGPRHTMLEASRPVIAVCASRTGAGKSQTSRHVVNLLQAMGKRVVAVRHPMPYGDLAAQAVQRFATSADLDYYNVTIEEREEYEPYLCQGHVVYAGVDYARIIRRVQEEAEIIVWDGGNNDLPFLRPDLWITVVDPLRASDMQNYFPGDVNLRRAHVIVINKVDTAGFEAVEQARAIALRLNPDARFVDAASPVIVPDGQRIRGKRVLVVEDGPTLTHGGMAYGAGWVAACRYGAEEVIDPRPFAVGTIADTFARWPSIGNVLPAMGYGAEQVRDLSATIAATPADLVLVATPMDLTRLMRLQKPALRVRYELQEIGEPTLRTILEPVLLSWEQYARPVSDGFSTQSEWNEDLFLSDRK